MTESVLDLRARLMPNRPSSTPVPRENGRSQILPASSSSSSRLPAPAFVVEDPESHRVVLTVPAETAALITADDFLLKLSGRLVEAEKANGNGAFWSQDDLEFGLPSVAYGPLNWLHEERKVVGVLTDARLVSKEQAAQEDPELNTHVRAESTMWRWLYPREAALTAAYSDSKQLWYSMECISREIACQAADCGRTMAYKDAMNRTSECCEHIRERSAARRFVQPIFQGSAIIVPPVKPGWANADLAVQRTAAGLVEKDQIEVPDLDTVTTERMVAQVLAWARA